jgi:glycosyltransferase involved in cell wall biosynthesis
MSQPLVSVVIPTFNYGHLVGEAVESVLAQTYPHVETIVVDDGSTDDTRQRLARYGDRIRYHYQPNAGLSAARNTGIELAQGELIAFLDSDDAFHPRKLEIQVDWMQRHPSIGLCAADFLLAETPCWEEVDVERIAAKEITIYQLVMKSQFGACGVLSRRRCFQVSGHFDPALRSVEDRDMWIRIAAHFRIVKLNARLWWYRPTPGSMSRNAARMEHFERVVLDKAFQMPELRRRWLLRQKAYGLAAASAAYMHLQAGSPRIAVRRLLTSLLYWPLPYFPPTVNARFIRARLLASMIVARPATPTS